MNAPAAGRAWKNMELRHLQTFVLVAQKQSFTRAAEALGLTQAAVSQHIAVLERELAGPLFCRKGRSVRLTDLGKKAYEYAAQILALVEELYQQGTGIRDELRGTIRIASSTVPAEWLLPDLLARFRQRFPCIQPLVAVSDSATAVQSVKAGTAELALVGELPRDVHLCARAVAQDELTLVVGPDHPLARKKSIPPEQLRGEPLIVREPGSGSRRCLELALARVGLDMNQLTISMEVNSNEAIRAAVERGIGIAFLSTRAIRRELAQRRLVAVAVQGLRAVRDLFLVTDARRPPSQAVQAFLELLAPAGPPTPGQTPEALSRPKQTASEEEKKQE